VPRCLFLIIVLLAVSVCFASGRRLEVLLLTESFPGTDAAFVDTLRSTLESQGFAVKPIAADELVSVLSDRSDRLLVLPNSACFPVDSISALKEYLAAGGNLLTIGGPPLSRLTVKVGGEWVTQQTLIDKLSTMPPGETILDFGRFTPSPDYRDTGTPDTEPQVKAVTPDTDAADSALEVSIPSCVYWEFQDIPITGKFPASDTVTTFWAKGDENARKLIVAWIDSDGGRWQAHLDLTTSWKRYTVTAELFRHWKGPGGPGDVIDVQKVVKFKVGFENSNLVDPGKPVTFRITDIRSMPNPAGAPDFSQPTLETLSPVYKTYSADAAVLVPTFGSYKDCGDPAITGPVHTVCSLPRYRGLGFNKTAPHRWIPALAVKEADGQIGGAAAALYVQDDDTYKGTVWATFGIEDPDFLAGHRAEVARETASLVDRIDGGLYLLSAGTDHASYFDPVGEGVGLPPRELGGGKESNSLPNGVSGRKGIIVGATALNLGDNTGSVEIECNVTNDPAYDKSFDTHIRLDKTFDLAGKRTICELGPIEGLAPGFYVAEVWMLRDGKPIDAIRQPFSVVESKPVDKSELVTIEGDQFIYKGKPWFSLGINYRPVYVASMEEKPFWEHWCHPNQYDAEIIEMELDLMNKIGLNTVALIYENSEVVPPAFVDFMERAHRHGLKCHVYIAGVEPFWPDPPKTVALIKAARLWERPAMFAYDTGWEVRVGREEKRQGADPMWKRWIEDRYGSVENAEQDWGFTLRKEENGRVHGPTDSQVAEDGPWNKMVAAYRHFCDDRFSRAYAKTTKVVRDLDPYHPIGVRSGFGGTGTMAAYALPLIPVDLFSGTKHLDYVSPEGYNFSGDWQSFREGGFTTLYGKFASGGKPIYWAELGFDASLNPPPERLEAQRAYYEKIYKVFYETRSAGSAAWWWPGYLIWERSDYSIINPDFTMRPSALEYTKMAKTADKPYPQKKPNYWIEIDRDLYATGYAGMLADKRAEYGRAISEGKTVGLRTKGTGTDSSDFPRIAIGDTPMNGRNAPKYLNAEFNSLEIQDSHGQWISLVDGDEIEVQAGQPVHARASLGNIDEVKWLAPKGKRAGAVYLRARVGDTAVLAPIKADTPFLSDADVPEFTLSEGIKSETRVSFQLIVGIFAFGEKRYVNLAPTP